MAGWISLHRQIQDHWLWEDKPFSKGQAWIDLLLLVNHTEGKTLIDGELMLVERGQRITSIRQLGDRWGWSRHKVDDFLKLLESDEMIVQKRDSKKTIITIENYSNYQDANNSKEPPKSHQRATKEPVKDTNNKKDNNNNNNNLNIYTPVIEYLNLKCSTSYKSTSNKTKACIDARVNEGFTLEDFKKVIDIKAAEWLNTDMAKYLRPETLFGNKFESYLNQKPATNKPQQTAKPNKFHNFNQEIAGKIAAMGGETELERKLKEKFNRG